MGNQLSAHRLFCNSVKFRTDRVTFSRKSMETLKRTDASTSQNAKLRNSWFSVIYGKTLPKMEIKSGFPPHSFYPRKIPLFSWTIYIQRQLTQNTRTHIYMYYM